jgi:hypothetical protein
MRHLIPFFLATAIAPAQWVSVGVKAGVPVTEALTGRGRDFTGMLDTGRWTVGPTAELRLFYGFSVEVDALYRGYREQQSLFTTEFVADGRIFPPIANIDQSNVKVWDFPVLLKRRFGSGRYRPFVSGGYTWSHSTTDVTSSFTCLGGVEACNATPYAPFFSPLNRLSDSKGFGGPAAGAGVEFRLGKFKLAPEIRYTHSSNPTSNRVAVMVGFTY